MAHVAADRVQETTTTTGTGTITLLGAVSGYRAFSPLLSTSDTAYVAIVHRTAAEWEVCLATLTGASALARTSVLSSSNSNSAVSFSAGTKDVFICIPASKGYIAGGAQPVALSDGGTGASLSDPGADRIPFWDDSEGAIAWLEPGTNLSITGTKLDASGGGSAAEDQIAFISAVFN